MVSKLIKVLIPASMKSGARLLVTPSKNLTVDKNQHLTQVSNRASSSLIQKWRKAIEKLLKLVVISKTTCCGIRQDGKLKRIFIPTKRELCIEWNTISPSPSIEPAQSILMEGWCWKSKSMTLQTMHNPTTGEIQLHHHIWVTRNLKNLMFRIAVQWITGKLAWSIQPSFPRDPMGPNIQVSINLIKSFD